LSERGQTPEEDEDIPIRAREVVLMVVFGIIPITAIYVVAAMGMQDEGGRQFEADRTAVMQQCIDANLERMDCRQVVDAKIVECAEGREGDPGAQVECVIGEHEGWGAASRDAKRRAKEAAEKRDRGRFARPDGEEAREEPPDTQ
jgi:hypothetical protein